MKKGDVGVEPLVVISVAIAVLAIVGFGYYLYLNDKISFFNFLPGFNITNDPQNNLEIVRYRILTEEIQYYNGIDWLEFDKDQMILGGKIVDVDDLDKSLGDYWFGWDGFYVSVKAPYPEIFSEKGLRNGSIKSSSGFSNIILKGFVYNSNFYSGEGEQFVRCNMEGNSIIYRMSLRNEL